MGRSYVPPSLALLVALLGTASFPAAQDPPAETPPTFRGGIDAVRVDVLVSDADGAPITDLTQADFEVTEDGAPQAIESFKAVRIDHAPRPDDQPQPIRSLDDEEWEAGKDDVRLFVLFFSGPVPRAHMTRVREALVAFVTSLAPRDMVAVVDEWTPLSSMMLTRDRDAAIRAVRTRTDLQEDLLRRQQIQWAILNGDLDRRPLLDGLRGLQDISGRLAFLRDGRQSIVFIGTSLGGPELTLDYSETVTTLNRNNTAVYALDTAGLAVGRNFTRTINLRGIAEDTGGLAVVNTNRLEENLAGVVTDASYYYLLGYTSPAPADGKFHRIGVAVTRPGARVRARSGFWAFTASELRRREDVPQIPVPVQHALASIAAPVEAARHVRTWIGAERADGVQARVTLVWEPAPAPPGERRAAAARVTVIVKDGRGEELFRGSSPDPADSRPSDARHQLVFQVPPGRADMTLSVESEAGLVDIERHSIDVPDFEALQEPALTTPRVFVARSVPELRAIVADAASVPVASREFRKTDRLLVRFTVFPPQTAPSAALLNRLGQKMRDLPVSPAAAGGTHQIELGLSSVPPGEYLIEVRPDAGAIDGALVPLRIRG